MRKLPSENLETAPTLKLHKFWNELIDWQIKDWKESIEV